MSYDNKFVIYIDIWHAHICRIFLMSYNNIYIYIYILITDINIFTIIKANFSQLFDEG